MDSQDKNFLEKLKRHPELRSRFDQILSIADNSGDELVTLADEAELLVIGQMRKLGQATLQDLANSESTRVSKNVKLQVKDAKKHIKKNSGGTQHSEK